MITTFFTIINGIEAILWMETKNVTPKTRLATAVEYEESGKIAYSPVVFGSV